MNKLTRLTILSIVLAGLTLMTGIAFASGSQTALGIELRGNGTSDDKAISGSAGVNLRGNGILDDNSSPGSMSTTEEMEFFGTVDSITSDLIVVSGTQIVLNSSTEIEDAITVGDLVKVHAYTAADGQLTAREVELYDTSDDMEDSSASESGQNASSDDQSSSAQSHLSDDESGSSSSSQSGDDKSDYSFHHHSDDDDDDEGGSRSGSDD